MTTTTTMQAVAIAVASLSLLLSAARASDQNGVYSPCEDATVQRRDGFSFGVAFASYESFFSGQTRYSPCDSRLQLQQKGAQLAVFRPKVDEISFLSINSTNGNFDPANLGGYMVAFAGRKYAARSFPALVGNGNVVVTGFTLVLEFKKGTIQNLYWKTNGCSSCKGADFVCVQGNTCGVNLSSCKSRGGQIDCSLGIQVAFSGTDKHDAVLNSWYEVSNMNQYSLYGLYSNLKGSVTDPFKNFFG